MFEHHTLPTPDAQPMAGEKPIVFFDGDCRLCRREIAHYQRQRGAANLHWIDVARTEACLSTYGLSREAAMARFHVLDKNGRWQTGAWGFVELWSHLPSYRWLAWSLRGLRLLPLVDRAYTVFARWRLRHRCVGGSCDTRGY